MHISILKWWFWPLERAGFVFALYPSSSGTIQLWSPVVCSTARLYVIILLPLSCFSFFVQGSLKSKPVAGSQCILQPESSVASQVQTGCTPLLQSPEDSPDVTPTAVTPSSCQEKTHFRIPAPATSSEDQPGDGYEARLKAEPHPQLRPQGCDVSNDDGYMQRTRITNNTSDSPRSSLVIEISLGNWRSEDLMELCCQKHHLNSMPHIVPFKSLGNGCV